MIDNAQVTSLSLVILSPMYFIAVVNLKQPARGLHRFGQHKIAPDQRPGRKFNTGRVSSHRDNVANGRAHDSYLHLGFEVFIQLLLDTLG